MHPDTAHGVLFCDHCGAQEELQAIIRHVAVGDDTSSLCPTCATPLSDSRLDGYVLLFCKSCLGMLIEMKSFADVIEAARGHEKRVTGIVEPRRQDPGGRLLRCPRCAQPMLSHFYEGPGNLVIDTCERCGVNWLDPGELRRIARAPHGRYDDRL